MSLRPLAGGALLGLLLLSAFASPAYADEPPPATAEAAEAAEVVPPPPPSLLDDEDKAYGGYTPGADAGMSEFIWGFVKSMLMLCVVLALIYLVLHKGLGRLVQRTQSGRRMRVVERIALDQRRALYLVEVDGREVLLAGSEGGVVPVDVSVREEPKTAPVSFQAELERQRPAGEGAALSALKKAEG